MCAHTHGETSAAAPNAVGVFALALEARLVSLSNMSCIRFLKAYFVFLTWRDIQHFFLYRNRPND